MASHVRTAALGFLLGLAGTSALAVSSARQTNAAVAAAVAQALASRRAAEPAARSDTARTPLIDSLAARRDSAALATAIASTRIPAPTPATPARPAAPSPQAVRLGKLFGAMQAKEAARILEQMSERDAQSILALVGDRQAAAILAALPPARAAAVSRLTMGAARDSALGTRHSALGGR